MSGPPGPTPHSPTTTDGDDGSRMPYGIPVLDRGRINARPGQLTRRWQWVAIIGWAIAIYGISAAGQGGDQLGKPPWWLDGALVAIPFALPLAAGISTIANWRWSTYIGVAAAVGTGAVALGDRVSSPGVAAAEGVIAVVALLTTIAASAGRVPGSAPTPAIENAAR